MARAIADAGDNNMLKADLVEAMEATASAGGHFQGLHIEDDRRPDASQYRKSAKQPFVIGQFSFAPSIQVSAVTSAVWSLSSSLHRRYSAETGDCLQVWQGGLRQARRPCVT